MRSLQLFIATLAAASGLRVGGAPRLQPRSSRVVLQQPPEATDGDDEPEPYRAERPTV